MTDWLLISVLGVIFCSQIHGRPIKHVPKSRKITFTISRTHFPPTPSLIRSAKNDPIIQSELSQIWIEFNSNFWEDQKEKLRRFTWCIYFSCTFHIIFCSNSKKYLFWHLFVLLQIESLFILWVFHAIQILHVPYITLFELFVFSLSRW